MFGREIPPAAIDRDDDPLGVQHCGICCQGIDYGFNQVQNRTFDRRSPPPRQPVASHLHGASYIFDLREMPLGDYGDGIMVDYGDSLLVDYGQDYGDSLLNPQGELEAGTRNIVSPGASAQTHPPPSQTKAPPTRSSGVTVTVY